MASATNAQAVVLGLHENGLGVVRSLGREGVPVIAVDENVSTAYAATRYAHKVSCPDFEGLGLIETLCEIGVKLETPGVLIPTMDRNVLLLSEHRVRIDPYFRHSLPPDGVVQRLMSKAATRKYAEKHGFQMPQTFEIESEADLNRCMDRMQLPCILKPQVKTVAFDRHTPKKAFLLHSLDELRMTYQMVAQWEREVVVQEWIPGPDTNLIFCLYYFNNEGEPVAWFTGRKLRQFIPYCGTACSAEPWEDRFVQEAGIRFFHGVDYRGFGAIEFKRDVRDGAYYLMEPTVGRTEHLFALAAANGVNLPYIGYCDMAGQPLPRWGQGSRPVRYLNWKRDFMAARVYRRSGELNTIQWLKSLGERKQYTLFAWDDSGPFLSHIAKRMMGKPRKAVRKGISALKTAVAFLSNPLSLYPTSRRGDPRSNRAHIDATLDWLCTAQDATGSGGVARGYSFKKNPSFPIGWEPPYPETTGYIIPTFFDCAGDYQHADLRQRAIQMADWEIEIQLPNGGVLGGLLGEGQAPVVFDTGQVIFGWCRAYQETGNDAYLSAAGRAAAFLIDIQDKNGAWSRFSNTRGNIRVHAYDVRVAWALLQVYQLTGDDQVREAAIRNLEFTLTLQQPNGWYRSNDLSPKRNRHPLTHTIGYAMRGVLECGLALNESRYVARAKIAADAVLEQLQPNGFLAGRLSADWKPTVRWSCLTGNAQMAIIWLKFYQLTGDSRYLNAAQRATCFLKTTQDLHSSNPGIRGGIAGSYPTRGHYGRYQYLNWAAKFFVDALLLEERCNHEK